MLRITLASLLAILLAATTVAAALAAAPPLPSSFYGAVTVAGQPVPAGTAVSAWVNGTQYAATTTFMNANTSVYRLDVPGDDPDTPEVEGGRAGDTVRFKLAGFDADQTAPWSSGAYTRLDLTADAAAAPPVANDQAVTTDEDTPKAITLTAFDFNHDPLTFTVVTAPTHGLLSGTAPNLTYAPQADYNGPDSFTFKANDGTFDSNVATVSITVRPVNDAPRIAPIGDQTIDEGDTHTLFVTATDPEGDPITLSASRLPPFATFVDNGNGRGTLTLAPGFDAAGIYSRVTISASDGLRSASHELTITVGDAAPLPRVRFLPGKGMNVALLEDGASIDDSSSAYSSSFGPENAIDNNTATAWVTGNGQAANQWIKVKLTGTALHVVDRVVLKGSSGLFGMKRFEIRVATNGTADADFTTILTGTVPQDDNLHEFSFAAVQARYVELFIHDNWGWPNFTSVYQFQVWTRDREGGIVSLQEGPPAAIAGFSTQYSIYAPENAIDENIGSPWISDIGQMTNQWFKVRLGGGLMYTIDRVRLQSESAPAAPRDFEIRVSTTSDADAAFTTVFSGTAANDSSLQEFVLAAPVQARYVQLFVRNNQSNSCCVRVDTFQVLTPDGANVARLEGVGAFVLAASSQAFSTTGPEKAIDFSANTFWQTANGQWDPLESTCRHASLSIL